MKPRRSSFRAWRFASDFQIPSAIKQFELPDEGPRSARSVAASTAATTAPGDHPNSRRHSCNVGAPSPASAPATSLSDSPRESAENIPEVVGKIHSVESMTGADGPGLRYLVFLQGCPRRCVFCANPDSWAVDEGFSMSTKEIAKKIARCRAYLRPNGGGLTLSGGEALMQPQFVANMFREVKSMGLTTCLDTSGWGNDKDWDLVLPHTDLVLLCLKSLDPEKYKDLTKTNIRIGLKFAERLRKDDVSFWLRYVLIPGHTDSEEELQRVEKFISEYPNCKALEILPYHRLGEDKWAAMGMEYVLEGLSSPTNEQVERVRQRFAPIIRIVCQ